MDAAGEVVAELMGEEYGEQRKGEWPAELEALWVREEPRPGPEVAFVENGRESIQKILHEARSAGSSGKYAEEEKQRGQDVFAEVAFDRFRSGFGAGKR